MHIIIPTELWAYMYVMLFHSFFQFSVFFSWNRPAVKAGFYTRVVKTLPGSLLSCILPFVSSRTPPPPSLLLDSSVCISAIGTSFNMACLDRFPGQVPEEGKRGVEEGYWDEPPVSHAVDTWCSSGGRLCKKFQYEVQQKLHDTVLYLMVRQASYCIGNEIIHGAWVEEDVE